MTPRILACALALAALVALPGCINVKHTSRHSVQRSHGHGPPPHAPAHGYRHKHRHHGVSLEFDSRLGVYLVLGRSDHYFHDGLYYRWSSGRWERSATLHAGWVTISVDRLPVRLHTRHHVHHRRGPKWQHPAKRRH